MRMRTMSNPYRYFVTIAAVIAVMMSIRPVAAALAPGDCVDFEDLQLGTVYTVPANFLSSGTTITTSAFQWTNGTWTSAGSAQVQNIGLSGGTGYDLAANNITVNFDFGRPVENLRVFFHDYGGNVNLTVNGDFNNVLDLDELNEQIVGGTFVEVSLSPTGSGIMVINGTVNSFSIGGQELWIDDICEATVQTGCIEFEDLPLAEQYEYGQFFVDSGVGMLVEEFFWFPSGSTTDEYALVDNSQDAGGTGQDLYPNNTNIFFAVDEPLAEISVLYHNFGGNVNLIVNDVLANVENFADLHMTTLGGATITLQPPTGEAGTLTVSGLIESFAIGGQETWIDHVCRVPSLVFSDDFESGDTSQWSNTVP